MKIGVIVAMEKEMKALSHLLDDARTESHRGRELTIGSLRGLTIIMQQCGIGKVNSALGAAELIDGFKPDLVISTGCAGGADTRLNVMDVVVARECAYHDVYCGDEVDYGQVIGLPARFSSPDELVEEALALNGETKVEEAPALNGEAKVDEALALSGEAREEGARRPRIVAGLTVSGDWFVDSREKMRAILSHFPEATAVDMESCSIAQTCHIYATPFLSFRIISDVPLKDNKAAQYFDFWDRMAEGSFTVTRRFLERLAEEEE